MKKGFGENKNENSCPRCHFEQLKTWRELSEDERIVASKMPLSAEFSLDERKRHLFCVRCWFEETAENPINV